MILNKFFKEIGNAFNLENIEKAESGRYLLTIDDHYHLNIETAKDRNLLHLYTYIYPDLGKYTSFIAMKLMKINAFGKITGSAQLSFSPEDSKFVLSESFNLNQNSSAYIISRIQEFVKILKFFRKKWNSWLLELVTVSREQEEEKEPEKGHIIYKL